MVKVLQLYLNMYLFDKIGTGDLTGRVMFWPGNKYPHPQTGAKWQIIIRMYVSGSHNCKKYQFNPIKPLQCYVNVNYLFYQIGTRDCAKVGQNGSSKYNEQYQWLSQKYLIWEMNGPLRNL